MGIETIIIGVVPVLVTLAWEHWLGSTDKVDANSTGRLIADLLVKLVKK